MLGGLYKRSTYLEQYRKEHGDIVIVDSGDLLNESMEIRASVKESVELKADLTAEVYKMTGIDAINVGELDLALGLDFLRELEEKHDLPLVSANLVDESGRLVFNPYVIRNIGQIRIGIFGLMGDNPEMVSRLKEAVGARLSIKDPVETAGKVIQELKGRVDLIIALTHNPMDLNKVIAQKVDGIGVIVGGHLRERVEVPHEVNDTYIVQAGENNQYQGMLEYTLLADGKRSAKNKLVPLGESIPDDEKILAMINEYNQKVTAMFKMPERKGPSRPVKAVSCRDCHSEAVEVWMASDHAGAFQTLVNRSRQFNPDCLACHTTRFEEPGGFSMLFQPVELRNVQCDSCHGNSDAHLENIAVLPDKKPDMASCMECHTRERSPDFERDYDEIWESIRH